MNDRIDILLGDGNGSFSTVATYDGESNSHPIWLNVVHFNSNNQSDLVIVNSHSNSILLLNDSYFQSAARQRNYGPQISQPMVSVVISDLNNDSFVDIVFGPGENIFILTGFGNGSLNEDTMYSLDLNGGTQYICVGDLNNDGRMDIIIADCWNGYLNIFLGYGNGSFAPMKNDSTGRDSQPRWIGLADLNDDDVLDIVCTNYGTRNLNILLGNGDGTFSTMLRFSTSDNSPPHSVAVGQLNDDNHSDLVVSDGWGSITISLGIGNGSFIIWKEYRININDNFLFSVSVGHLNSDTHLDIVVGDTRGDNIAILRGYGNGTFTKPSRY